jgi:hypothetical protein
MRIKVVLPVPFSPNMTIISEVENWPYRTNHKSMKKKKSIKNTGYTPYRFDVQNELLVTLTHGLGHSRVGHSGVMVRFVELCSHRLMAKTYDMIIGQNV